MDRIRRADVEQLLEKRSGPCVSLYMPMFPDSFESNRDVVLLRDLADEAEEALLDRGMRRPDAVSLLAPLRALPEDRDAWQHRGRALAAFAAPGFVRVVHTAGDIDAAVHVNDRFHLRPLVQLMGEEDRYFLLAVSPNSVRLLEGNANGLAEVQVPDLPRTLAAALNIDSTDRGEQVHSGQRGDLGKQSAVFHGQGGIPDHVKADLKSFLNVVAGVIDRRLNGQEAPLILATVEQTVPIWREVSRYKQLLDTFVPGNADYLTPAELHERAWPLVRPALARRRELFLRRLNEAPGTRVGVGLERIVPASIRGQIEALFIDCSRGQWGRYHPEDESVELHPERLDGDQDLVELATVETLRYDGEVFAIRTPNGQPPEKPKALLRF